MRLDHHEALLIETASVATSEFGVGDRGLDSFYFHFAKLGSGEIHDESKIEKRNTERNELRLD